MSTRPHSVHVLLVVLVLALSVGTAYAAPPDPGRSPAPGQGGPSGVEWMPEACTDILQDGSFEDGSPNSYWAEYSTNFGTPLCENGFCGTAGQAARTGSWWLWFGGIASYEEGYVTQTVTFPATGYAQLVFWMWSDTPDTTPEDYMAVQIDYTPVYTVTGMDTGLYPTWTQIQVPLSTYANGMPHTVSFYSEAGVTGLITNFHIDDAAICTNVPTSVSLVALDAAAAPAPVWPVALVAVLAAGVVLGTYRLTRRPH